MHDTSIQGSGGSSGRQAANWSISLSCAAVAAALALSPQYGLASAPAYVTPLAGLMHIWTTLIAHALMIEAVTRVRDVPNIQNLES